MIVKCIGSKLDVVLDNALTSNERKELMQHIDDALNRNDVTNICVDFDTVEHINAAGISLLLIIDEKIKKRGKSFCIKRVRVPIASVLSVVGVLTKFKQE